MQLGSNRFVVMLLGTVYFTAFDSAVMCYVLLIMNGQERG